MALIKSRNKISTEFSMSSMSDLIFLLLIFFVLTSTVVSPNALKLLLPKSANQVENTPPVLAISITPDIQYFVGEQPVALESMASILREKLAGYEDPTIALHADKSVPIEYVVNVMNIAKENKYRLILATSPN